jgi:Predicted molecular chaperone distantly related to HSP70-fold metalloproteases
VSLNINKKRTYNVLGIMTGTSMDGIDISLIKTNGIDIVKILKENHIIIH